MPLVQATKHLLLGSMSIICSSEDVLDCAAVANSPHMSEAYISKAWVLALRAYLRQDSRRQDSLTALLASLETPGMFNIPDMVWRQRKTWLLLNQACLRCDSPFTSLMSGIRSRHLIPSIHKWKRGQIFYM